MKTEEELVNEAVLAYSLGYHWEIDIRVLRTLSRDFPIKIIKGLQFLGTVGKSALMDSQLTLTRFNKKVFTNIITSEETLTIAHPQAAYQYVLTMRSYMRSTDEPT